MEKQEQEQEKPKRKVKVVKGRKANDDSNKEQRKPVNPDTPVSDEAMEKLARILNDTPVVVKVGDDAFKIRGLKPGTQWLIAEEACKIVREENMAMGDVIKQFAKNLPSVARVITLAILNDKDRIEGEEYKELYARIMWGDFDLQKWAEVLFAVLNLIDVNFFYASTGAIQTVRTMTLDRKTTMAEQGLSTPGQNGGR